MSNCPAAAYPWMKALHLVAVVSWMAGLFYLPRLFVYHAERGAPGSEMSETFKVMERRLLRLIMRPAMIATWVAGADLVADAGGRRLDDAGWLYVKLAAVLGLRACTTGWRGAARTSRRTATGVSGRTYRLVNEVPIAGACR